MKWFTKHNNKKILSIDVGSSAVKFLVTEGVYPESFKVLDYRLVRIGDNATREVVYNEADCIECLACIRVCPFGACASAF